MQIYPIQLSVLLLLLGLSNRFFHSITPNVDNVEKNVDNFFKAEDTLGLMAICENNLVITIAEQQGAVLHAAMVYGGSHLNNSENVVRSIRIKGTDMEWQQSVFLPCDLVGTQIAIALKVTDPQGNENFCWTYVRLEDKIAPICQALPDKALFCNTPKLQEFTNALQANSTQWLPMTTAQANTGNELFGHPVCVENVLCKSLLIEQYYKFVRKSCHTGKIFRRYRAVDKQGNEGEWLQQLIIINYKADWTITFPSDWEGGCTDTIPEPYLGIQNGHCDNLNYHIIEHRYTADETYCTKIERVYYITNPCLLAQHETVHTINRRETGGIVTDSFKISSDSFAAVAYLTYKQILRVRSTTKPNLEISAVKECLSKIDFNNKIENDCSELRTFSAFAVDCLGDSIRDYRWKFYTSDAIIQQGQGNVFTVSVLPDIPYVVEFTARDNCHNETVKQSGFVFKDCIKPTLFISTGTTLELNNKAATISATDFDKGSFDNCTNNEVLLQNFRIWHRKLGGRPPTALTEIKNLPTELTLTCFELAIQEVFIYAFDESDNFDRVETFVIVQDNQESCFSRQTVEIGGKIVTENNIEIEAVEVTLIGENEEKYITQVDGKFHFKVAPNATYSVQPSKKDHPLNGVTTLDVLLIQKHLLGRSFFYTPYQRIAADVNQSGAITAFDLVLLRQLILNIIPNFPNNKSWRFIETNYEFISKMPENESFRENLLVKDLENPTAELNFIGVKLGDVNGSAIDNESNSARSNINLKIADNYVDKPQLFQNQPNPFRHSTTIEFYVPQPEKILFRIINSQGKVLKELEKNAASGKQEILVQQVELEGQGVLYYQLITASSSITKKMLVID